MKLTKSKIAILILSIIGFFDSSYLTIVHYEHIVPPCTVTHGCETVLTSKFATFMGIPIALSGVLFFLVLIVLLLLGASLYFKIWLYGGVGVSFVLLYLQAFVIHAYCQYCLLVEAVVLTTLILSFFTNGKYVENPVDFEGFRQLIKNEINK
jgi:uncharacterized membrane protein